MENLHNQESNNIPPDIITNDPVSDVIEPLKVPTLPSLVLNGPIFASPVYEKLKNSVNITTIDELFEEFYNNKDMVKTLFFKALNNRATKGQSQKNYNVDYPSLKASADTSNSDKGNMRSSKKQSGKAITEKEKPKRKSFKTILLSPPPIREDEFQSLIDGTLVTKKILKPDYAHCFLYFDFGIDGTRSIERIKSFMKTLGINISKVSWIDLLDRRRIEIACRQSIREDVINKLGAKIAHLQNYNVDELYHNHDLDLLKVLPQDPKKFADRLHVISEKLNLLKVRKQLCNYITLLVNRIYTRIGAIHSPIIDSAALKNDSENMQVDEIESKTEDPLNLETKNNPQSVARKNTKITKKLVQNTPYTKKKVETLNSKNCVDVIPNVVSAEETQISQKRGISRSSLNPTSGAQL